MRRLYCNDSMFDSLGLFYSVISSTQGGWTWLSSEGRYMGAAAWGDMNRATNPYYARLRDVLHFGETGEVKLNRAMANWYRDLFDHPLQDRPHRHPGPPLMPEQLWNSDAVLRVEDIHHRPDTRDRLDKAAATQLVFEDALIHVVDLLLRITGASRLVLTGGVALNANGNMRLLEDFDEAWFAGRSNARRGCICGFRRCRRSRRHYRRRLAVRASGGCFARRADDACVLLRLATIQWGHRSALEPMTSPRIASVLSDPDGRDAIADLMAFMVARDGVIALYQGAAETGPRALGHRSIFANPCDPEPRERLNERVKYREAIRPLAPMATLDAARAIFRAASGRVRRRLQRLQLHGADGAIEAGGA